MVSAETITIAKLVLPLVEHDDFVTTLNAALCCRDFYRMMEKRLVAFWLLYSMEIGRRMEMEIADRQHKINYHLRRLRQIPKMNGYNLFVKDYSQKNPGIYGRGIMTGASMAWRAMSQSDKSDWNNQAKTINQTRMDDLEEDFHDEMEEDRKEILKLEAQVKGMRSLMDDKFRYLTMG